MIQQGAVTALTNLSNYCGQELKTASRIAIALCNLSGSDDISREIMLQDGAIQTIVALSSNYNNRIQQDSARAICNLSYINGMETLLERQGGYSLSLSLF